MYYYKITFTTGNRQACVVHIQRLIINYFVNPLAVYMVRKQILNFLLLTQYIKTFQYGLSWYRHLKIKLNVRR